MVHTNTGCHHTGTVLSISVPEQVTEDHPVQQEGQSQCTCPSSGSSSHVRKQGEIKVYLRSHQVKDSKSSSNQLGHQRKYHKPSGALTRVPVNKLITLLLSEVKNYLTNYLNEGWGGWHFSLEKRRLQANITVAFQYLKGPCKMAGERFITRAYSDRTRGSGFKFHSKSLD